MTTDAGRQGKDSGEEDCFQTLQHVVWDVGPRRVLPYQGDLVPPEVPQVAMGGFLATHTSNLVKFGTAAIG
jgi:hypothetical protein